jgi:hypothetical protein
MVALNAVQVRNFSTSRRVFDAWYQGPDAAREAWWVRLVAALWTESGCRILAHDGVWQGGGQINTQQSVILAASLQYPHDDIGHNGGSVGALQQIPTPVAEAADKPWAGWGTIPDCMALETSIPKFLTQLRVTNNTFYGSKKMADPIVADLLRVQQPLESEVQANYGGAVVAAALEIAGMFPQTQGQDWFLMATAQELADIVKAAVGDRLDVIAADVRECKERLRGDPNAPIDMLQSIGMGVRDLQEADDATKVSLEVITAAVTPKAAS